MDFKLTGELIKIYPPKQITEKFTKHEFVLKVDEIVNDRTYTHYIVFNHSALSLPNEGSSIEVKFSIRGNSYSDKQTGEIKYISNIYAYKIEVLIQTPPMELPPQIPAKFEPQPMTIPPKKETNYAKDKPATQQSFIPATSGDDDLPF